MKKQILSVVLTITMALSLTVPALAYETPDFADVPAEHWAYSSIMEMADQGVIKGTGAGQFSPTDKLTAEMFVVLVGRVVFPDVEAEGADWSGPYVAEAKSQDLLAGTTITDATLKSEISRYDMAVILAKSVGLLKVEAAKADSSKVSDYGDIPTRYVDAVLLAYGSGLIQGDQMGNFNGSNSMTRAEAAVVMARLRGLKAQTTTVTTKPETPVETVSELYVPQTSNTKTFTVYGYVDDKNCDVATISGVQIGFFFKDGRMLGQTTTDADGKWSLEVTVDAEDYQYSNDVYYVALLAPVEYNGYRYTKFSGGLNNLMQMDFLKGWRAHLSGWIGQ